MRVPSASRIYISFDKHSAPVVGVIDRLQVPWSKHRGWGSQFFYNSMLVPYRMSVLYSNYVVRTKPGQLAAVMKTAQKTLVDLDRERVISKIKPLSVARVGILQGRSRLGGDPGHRVRGAPAGHGVRHRRADQLLGRAAPPPDRHSPRARREQAGHRALFPDGEPAHRRVRNGRSASRSPSPPICGW